VAESATESVSEVAFQTFVEAWPRQAFAWHWAVHEAVIVSDQ